MMVSLPLDTWIRLIAWLAIGLFIYFAYSRKHSALRKTRV
jgi:APA family basic amino acid/polyamine antiporter